MDSNLTHQNGGCEINAASGMSSHGLVHNEAAQSSDTPLPADQEHSDTTDAKASDQTAIKTLQAMIPTGWSSLTFLSLALISVSVLFISAVVVTLLGNGIAPSTIAIEQNPYLVIDEGSMHQMIRDLVLEAVPDDWDVPLITDAAVRLLHESAEAHLISVFEVAVQHLVLVDDGELLPRVILAMIAKIVRYTELYMTEPWANDEGMADDQEAGDENMHDAEPGEEPSSIFGTGLEPNAESKTTSPSIQKTNKAQKAGRGKATEENPRRKKRNLNLDDGKSPAKSGTSKNRRTAKSAKNTA